MDDRNPLSGIIPRRFLPFRDPTIAIEEVVENPDLITMAAPKDLPEAYFTTAFANGERLVIGVGNGKAVCMVEKEKHGRNKR